MSAYTDFIREATCCTASDAAIIEQLVRVDHPTLDHLDAATLALEAHVGASMLATLRAEGDDETIAFYTRQASCA